MIRSRLADAGKARCKNLNLWPQLGRKRKQEQKNRYFSCLRLCGSDSPEPFGAAGIRVQSHHRDRANPRSSGDSSAQEDHREEALLVKRPSTSGKRRANRGARSARKQTMSSPPVHTYDRHLQAQKNRHKGSGSAS